jgi:hypothetical protein
MKEHVVFINQLVNQSINQSITFMVLLHTITKIRVVKFLKKKSESVEDLNLRGPSSAGLVSYF